MRWRWSDRSGRRVRVEFPGFPYLGIWSATGGAPFVCIEPWFGVAPTHGAGRDLSLKEGIRSLEPGRTFDCRYRIAVD